MTFNVLVASRSFGPNCPEAIQRLKDAGAILVSNPWGRSPNEAELASAMRNIDVLISGTEPVTARVMDAAPELMFIAKHGVGYENIDLEAAKARGVPVAIAGGAISDSVADMAMALLLALARHIPQGDRAVRHGQWPRMVGVELRGQTIGIVGLGQIGREVALRALAFGMSVIAFDLYPNEAFAKAHNIQFKSLHEVLMQSDFVSLHAPVTNHTRGMINAITLQSMKRTACLINTARGELIDEAALAQALQAGWIAGAACDVFVKEPPGNSPLLELDNFIAAPHNAGQTDAGLRKLGEVIVDNIIRLMRGEELLHRVA
jgi:phosphoglycerate dehydrogenase-like enzyme